MSTFRNWFYNKDVVGFESFRNRMKIFEVKFSCALFSVMIFFPRQVKSPSILDFEIRHLEVENASFMLVVVYKAFKYKKTRY